MLLAGARLFLEDGIAEGRDVLLRNGRIEAILPRHETVEAERMDLPADALLAPGFIDVQVNGGGGVQFNDTPTAEAALAIAAAHRRFGVTSILPTLITDDPALMPRAAEAVEAAHAVPCGGVLGVHFEGPFISPVRPGVHAAAHIRPLGTVDLALLTALPARLPGGRVVVTLAPEMVEDSALAALAGAGVILSGGHSAASYERTIAAIGHGLRGFTHLFNAMPPATAREPGIIAAALLDPRSWCGVIADGIHVHPAMLRLAMTCKPDRVLLVSDAMAPTGSAQDSFTLNGRTILRRDGRLVTAEGVLAGADTDMASEVRNCVHLLGLPLESALRMASAVPASFLGLDDHLGRIAPGLRADLVLLSPELEVLGSWANGVWQRADGTDRLL
ncbi:MAG TPA: N-acetylglucosamine-6-phosphate deacetylase [Acetobacteraceae bacterium]|nr:N-acetylglucosamine-6-phosphate deacetylase [Acetobacteraceae bacterium]